MALLCLVAVVCPHPGCSRESRPSIVLILIDTLRFDYLGCYGFGGSISPADIAPSHRPRRREPRGDPLGHRLAYLRQGPWASRRREVVHLNAWGGRYGAGMRYLDRALGGFIRRLEKSGVLDTAYLVMGYVH